MLALLGGGAAAFCFAASNLAATAATRTIGGGATLAWVAITGCCVLVVPVALAASPSELSGDTWWLLLLSGVANVAGLRLVYHAYTQRPVGVVAAIGSTEGMVVALLALLAGARLSVATVVLLALVSLGVALAAAAPDAGPEPGQRLPVLLVVAIPLAFGGGLYLTSKGAGSEAVLWAALAPRVAGLALIAAPLAASRGIKLTARAAPIVALAGLCEAVGFIFYVLGARHGVAISAVAASQFSALAAVGAYFLFAEVLTRRQLAGIVLTVLGVGALAATTG
jgi:drug/metabolite transporter (DMT)-like permease